MKKSIQKIAGLIRNFGFPGIYFVCINKLNKMNFLRGIVSIRFPGIKYPVYLRAGTSDFQLFENIFISGEYDISLPFTPVTIIDGGANIGLAAIVFANKYPDAKIVSIEPEESNYNILQRNIAKYNNVSSLKAGIWPNSSFLKISNPASGKWAFTIEETDHPDENSIQGISISDIINTCGWQNADIIKLDIEGSEKEVFEDHSRSWLTTVKAIIVELHDWMKPGCTHAVYNATGGFNFQTSFKGENVIFMHEH